MKQFLLVLIIISLSVLGAVEKIDLLDSEPFPLQHWLSAEESARWDEIGRDFYVTDPPPAPIHNVAEFEQMEGVLVRYPFGIPVSLIALMSGHTRVITIVSSTSQQNTVTNQYNNNGVNIDNCEFLIAPSDSYWTRDYGPWYVIDGDDEFGIVNFPYNRPRPNDNDIPIEMADYLGINLFGMDVIHTGGNYMTDGLGISASTTLVYDENTISDAEVNLRMMNYLSIQTYYVIQDPNNTYIDHIDCWGKFLGVDKVLIREVPTTHAQYDEIEEVADYFAEQTTSWGNNFQVFRVYTPNDQPYTNSLILNDHVYVPIMGSQWDDEALAAYEAAMPGYTVTGIMSAPPVWESTDALHCRAKGIANHQMLYINHLPYLEEQPADVDMAISCDLNAYSGEEIIADSVLCYYKVGGADYTALVMENIIENTWLATIPGQPAGSEVYYYLYAVDAGGNHSFHPLIGEPDAHVYYPGGELEPVLEINPELITMEMTPDTTAYTTLELSNTGGGVINYILEFQDTSRDLTGSNVTCSSQYFSPGETTQFSFTVANESNDDEWVNEVTISFPAGFTVNSASDFTGGSGGVMEYDGNQGNGITVTWFGETVNGYGVLHNGETASTNVEISVNAGFSGDAVLEWTISGDNYGSAPHTVNGEMLLEIYGGPVSWISADQLGGELWAMETDEINLEFNTAGLEQGIYSCNLIVTTATGGNVIPIALTVNNTAGDNDQLPLITESYIYPNPFCPNISRGVSTVNFTLSKNENKVTIAIYNFRGQKVADIFTGSMEAGVHNINWQGTSYSGEQITSGIYFYLVQAGNEVLTEKFILLK
ncbi:MAG: agmatine deiminase family protein [Candidatus Cloacimonetes bacterium]|nr:agmatine deiminase family protein [Candidatus Cloacimonadota bacterium]